MGCTLADNLHDGSPGSADRTDALRRSGWTFHLYYKCTDCGRRIGACQKDRSKVDERFHTCDLPDRRNVHVRCLYEFNWIGGSGNEERKESKTICGSVF